MSAENMETDGVEEVDPARKPDEATAGGMERPPQQKHSPELLAWVLAQTSDEEILAGIREIRETGGLELNDFIHELMDDTSPDA